MRGRERTKKHRLKQNAELEEHWQRGAGKKLIFQMLIMQEGVGTSSDRV